MAGDSPFVIRRRRANVRVTENPLDYDVGPPYSSTRVRAHVLQNSRVSAPFPGGHWVRLPHGILSLLASQPTELKRVAFSLICTVDYWTRKNTLLGVPRRSSVVVATLSKARLSFLCLFMYALIADPTYMSVVTTLLLQSVRLVSLLGSLTLRKQFTPGWPELRLSAGYLPASI